MNPGPALVLAVDGADQGESQGGIQGHMGVDFPFDACAGAHEVPVAVSAVAPDVAAVQEDVAFDFPFRIHGHGVFHAAGEAAVAGDEAFFVASDTVHTAQVVHFGGGQVLGAGNLAVQAYQPFLAVFDMTLVQTVKFENAEIAGLVIEVFVPAEAVAVLLVHYVGGTVVQLVVIAHHGIQSIVGPADPVAVVGTQIGLGPLVTVFQAPFGFVVFGGFDGVYQEAGEQIGVAFDAQGFKGAVGNVHAVGGVADPGPGAPGIDGGIVAGGHGFGALGTECADKEVVPVAQQVPILPVHADPVFAAGFVAGVIDKDSGDLVLGLPDGDDVVGGAGLFAGLEDDVELGVVGGVKAEDIFVQLVHILDFPRLDMQPIPNIAFPGGFAPGKFQFSVFAFIQVDFHMALVYGLGGQVGSAGHIPFFLVEFVDFAYQGVQVIDADFFAFVLLYNGLELFRLQDLGGWDFYFRQHETDSVCFSFFGSCCPFYGILFPALLYLAGYVLAFQVFSGAIELCPGIGIPRRPCGVVGCRLGQWDRYAAPQS